MLLILQLRKPCLVQDQGAPHEASLAQDIRCLGKPVHGRGIIEFGPKIAHTQNEDEGQYEQHGCKSFLHQQCNPDHAILDSAESHYLHDYENQKVYGRAFI